MGTTLLLFGVVLLVTPGPGIVVLGLGLAVLAAEFAWAHHWLRVIRERLGTVARNAMRFAYGNNARNQPADNANPERPGEP